MTRLERALWAAAFTSYAVALVALTFCLVMVLS